MPVKFLFRCVLSLLAAVLLSAPVFAAKKLTIVYTGSTSGNLDACTCREKPNGGIVKRSAVLAEIRKSGAPVFLFDSGDLFSAESDPVLAGYVVKAYRHMQYDAVCPGDQEFASGIGVFLKYGESLPFVCNNLRVKSDGGVPKNPFRRTVMVKRGGIKIGVIGSVNPDCFGNLPRSIASKLSVRGWAGEIKSDAANLRKSGADLVVLISHSGWEADKKLAGKITGVDVIISGHSRKAASDHVLRGGALVILAATDEARIGVLELEIESGKIVQKRNSYKLPTYNSKDDKAVRKMINQYKKESMESYKGLRFR